MTNSNTTAIVADISSAPIHSTENTITEVKVPRKRGRKKKIKDANAETDSNIKDKVPKKRGRKPKGGKFIVPNKNKIGEIKPIQNIILHLKCYLKDLNNINHEQFDTIDTYHFSTKSEEFIEKNLSMVNNKPAHNYSVEKNSDSNVLMEKLLELATQLHTNNIIDEKSACFWCTYEFDNPPIHIPKYNLNDTYQCYGCFCSPECATAYLFKEPIDSSVRFQRYHLLNYLYCKIYNYKKNIKPAPCPYYMLDKYYGNLTIQEYRRLLKNERLLLVVDKPLTRVLPELYDDNNLLIDTETISQGTYNIRRKAKPLSKTEILEETFSGK